MSVERITVSTLLIVKFRILPGLQEQARIIARIRTFFRKNTGLQGLRPMITFGIKEMHVRVAEKKGGETPRGIEIVFISLLNSVGLHETKPHSKKANLQTTATIKRKPLTTT